MSIIEGASFVDEFTPEEEKALESVEEISNEIDILLDRIISDIPSSRERSLVITKLEEAVMWLNRVPLS